MLRKGLGGGVESGESSTADTLKPTPGQPAQRFDHYELVTGEDGKPDELGRGAMGVTYKRRQAIRQTEKLRPLTPLVPKSGWRLKG